MGLTMYLPMLICDADEVADVDIVDCVQPYSQRGGSTRRHTAAGACVPTSGVSSSGAGRQL